MKLRVIWAPSAWDDYVDWQTKNRNVLRRINRLIADLQRDPEGPGIAKPEKLKSTLQGYASRRIDSEHRLIYRVRNGDLEILSCRGHYN